MDILADSYKKGGGKRRVVEFSKDKARSVTEFETYAPKAFASIKELPEDLRDRCIAMPLIRSQKNFPDPDDSIVDWREMRGKIYKYLIYDYGTIESTYSVNRNWGIPAGSFHFSVRKDHRKHCPGRRLYRHRSDLHCQIPVPD